MIKRKANYFHQRPVWIKYILLQDSNNKLKFDFIGKKQLIQFTFKLTTFYEEFRDEFYIKIKPIESKIIYLLYIF
jgi:hypothetical protein